MADLLEHLTPEDRDRLMGRAQRRTFARDEVILEEGQSGTSIFVLREGRARVERRHMEFRIEIAALVAGEVFGEMSFIDGIDASADVVADETCVVDVIDSEHVRAMMEEDPGFFGRFYQSLAAVLSRRLRETTDLGIAEFAWGGRSFEPEPGERETADGWGGGSPIRDLAADDEGTASGD